jgi:hypothetical protein
MYFAVGNGVHGRDYDNYEKKGDYAYYEKHVMSKKLGKRAWGGNLGPHVVLNIFDTTLVKEFTQV